MFSPKILLSVIAFLLLLPVVGIFSAAAFFSWRAGQWEQSIDRTEDGVLSFAQPYEKGPEESSRAVLLVHGFADSPEVWRPYASALAGEGYRVRAMRLPGWGVPMAKKRTVGLGDWEEAVIAEVEALRETHEEVLVVGHSLGGGLVAKVAGEGRMQADGIVLYAPLFDITSVRSPLLPVRAWYRLGRLILPSWMTLENIYGDHALVADPRPREERDPFFPRRYLDDLYRLVDYHAENDFVGKMPVLLILPGEDAVVKNEAAESWFERLPEGQGTLRWIEEAGHVMPIDFHPTEEVELLRQWIQSQP